MILKIKRIEFFNTPDEAITYKDLLAENYKKDKMIFPHTLDVEFTIEEVSYNEVKNIMTIEQYERLFSINLESNERLCPENLCDNKFVWNETEQTYQRVRYIYSNRHNKYCLCDGYGNNIENDELYTYRLGNET